MPPPYLPKLPCLCANLRRAARALTQRYEKALESTGLSATQLTILQALARAGEVTQGNLGEMLAMDSTSLTRTLRIMGKSEHGWVAERRGKDRRERWLQLSTAGVKKLRRAEPIWEEVQSQVQRELGAEDWNHLMQLTYRATETVKKGEKR